MKLSAIIAAGMVVSVSVGCGAATTSEPPRSLSGVVSSSPPAPSLASPTPNAATALGTGTATISGPVSGTIAGPIVYETAKGHCAGTPGGQPGRQNFGFQPTWRSAINGTYWAFNVVYSGVDGVYDLAQSASNGFSFGVTQTQARGRGPTIRSWLGAVTGTVTVADGGETGTLIGTVQPTQQGTSPTSGTMAVMASWHC